MGFYDSEAGVKQYIEIAEGYDGKELIEKLKKHLAGGSSILELGMGPGIDLDILKEDFNVTGSDNSEIFIQRYKALHSNADLLLLDAKELDIDRKFNAIYSNKVLHHLSYKDMEQSFKRQAKILELGGIAFHSFWYGTEIEDFDGLMFHQLTEDKLKLIIGDQFEIIEMGKYTEMEKGDSIYIIARLK